MYSACLRSREESSQTILAAGKYMATASHSERYLLGHFAADSDQCLCAGSTVRGHLTGRKVKLASFSKKRWWKWSSWHCPADSDKVCERSRLCPALRLRGWRKSGWLLWNKTSFLKSLPMFWQAFLKQPPGVDEVGARERPKQSIRKSRSLRRGAFPQYKAMSPFIWRGHFFVVVFDQLFD